MNELPHPFEQVAAIDERLAGIAADIAELDHKMVELKAAKQDILQTFHASNPEVKEHGIFKLKIKKVGGRETINDKLVKAAYPPSDYPEYYQTKVSTTKAILKEHLNKSEISAVCDKSVATETLSVEIDEDALKHKIAESRGIKQ